MAVLAGELFETEQARDRPRFAAEPEFGRRLFHHDVDAAGHLDEWSHKLAVAVVQVETKAADPDDCIDIILGMKLTAELRAQAGVAGGERHDDFRVLRW